MQRRLFTITSTAILGAVAVAAQAKAEQSRQSKRPNVLFVISDDQSYPYASAYGDMTARTPAFDRVAKSGVLFNRAYVTSPGSSPSRASILTGRYPWQNEQAGTHCSRFPKKYMTYPYALQDAGYIVGFTGKGWGPGNFVIEGWADNPAGKEYSAKKLTPPYKGIASNNYAESFNQFLAQRSNGEPFCFWFGCKEPHRVYEQDSYLKAGRKLEQATVPAYLPDHPIVRGDILDYATEIEWYDSQLALIIEKLEQIGELNNTIIIVTSDNGMPFPRAKANCYDQGIHVPLAISWHGQIPSGRTIDDNVSLVDIAPTIMDATGVTPSAMQPMSGKSMLPLLRSSKSGVVDAQAAVYACRERHSSARYNNMGYPQRMIIQGNYLYLRNLHPERNPAGDPYELLNGKPNMINIFCDIDNSPSKQFLADGANNPLYRPFFLAATAKRPAEELYNLSNDPYCTTNIIDDSSFAAVVESMSRQLDRELKRGGDSRVVGSEAEIWESYERYSGIRIFPEN